MTTATERARFWQNTRALPTGCIVWTRYINADGYGVLRWGSKNQRAHRIAYTLERGAVPIGMAVCHTCDIRHCCNPAHLFIGTVADNNHDMQSKGRLVNPTGAEHGRAKLTAAQVAEIKERAPYSTYAAIARLFNVERGQIRRIVLGMHWKSV